MARSTAIPFSDISYDVTNDETNSLLSTGRKLVELEAALAEHKAAIHAALTQRQMYIDGVLHQLLPTI
jgi:hypothetical protein